VPPAHEQAERLERLRVGVEAMSRLKPQELRCLLLRAEGYSYKQICDETGWSYTKVNRCISEGRRSFLERVAGIESGAECRLMAPLLSRLVDGETSPEDMALLRPHLRSCLACRATLRDYREAPARVAAFAPLLVTPHLLFRALARVQHLLAQLGAQKSAAVVAVAAALAGGGMATLHPTPHVRPTEPSPPTRHHPNLRATTRPVAHVTRRHAAVHHRTPRHTVHPHRAAAPAPAPAPTIVRKPAPAPPGSHAAAPSRRPSGGEFGP
jgi:hypothetical protein